MPTVTLNVVSKDDLMEIVAEMQALDVLAEDDENLETFKNELLGEDELVAAATVKYEDTVDKMMEEWLPARLRSQDDEVSAFSEELEEVVSDRQLVAALAGYRKGIEECLKIVTERLGDPFAD